MKSYKIYQVKLVDFFCAKRLTNSQNNAAVSLAVGKNFTIKAEQVVKDKPIKKHEGIKFESSNSKVVSVTSKGVIKAKKKGTCYIYVYAQNGVYKKIKVTVK